MNERYIGDQSSQDYMYNEEYAMRIFEIGTPDEIEQYRIFHNLTSEQIDLMRYYVGLRSATHKQMRKEKSQREITHPIATQEELSMGAYQEAIEPQVRDAMMAMRRKGYTTRTSGFGGLYSQSVRFDQLHLQEWHASDNLRGALQKKNINLRVKPDAIVFDCERALSIDEVKEAWNLIADALPDLGAVASQTAHPAAESFRKRQAVLQEI